MFQKETLLKKKIYKTRKIKHNELKNSKKHPIQLAVSLNLKQDYCCIMSGDGLRNKIASSLLNYETFFHYLNYRGSINIRLCTNLLYVRQTTLAKLLH